MSFILWEKNIMGFLANPICPLFTLKSTLRISVTACYLQLLPAAPGSRSRFPVISVVSFLVSLLLCSFLFSTQQPFEIKAQLFYSCLELLQLLPMPFTAKAEYSKQCIQGPPSSVSTSFSLHAHWFLLASSTPGP